MNSTIMAEDDTRTMDFGSVEDYFNHNYKLVLPDHPGFAKYLYFSYIYTINVANKEKEAVRQKQEQVEVLFKLLKLYKEKLKRVVKSYSSLKDQHRVFLEAH